MVHPPPPPRETPPLIPLAYYQPFLEEVAISLPLTPHMWILSLPQSGAHCVSHVLERVFRENTLLHPLNYPFPTKYGIIQIRKVRKQVLIISAWHTVGAQKYVDVISEM